MYKYFVRQIEHILCDQGWGTNFDDRYHTKLSKIGPHCSNFTSPNFANFSAAPRPIELSVPQFAYSPVPNKRIDGISVQGIK